MSGLFAAWFEINSAEGLHFLFVDQVRLFNLVLEPVQVLRVRQRLGRRVLVVGLEGLKDLLRLVAEIEDERVFLARAGAVEPREGLHRLQSRSEEHTSELQ